MQKNWNGSYWTGSSSRTRHLIPLNEMDEMRFQNKVSLNKEEFEALAKRLGEIVDFKPLSQN